MSFKEQSHLPVVGLLCLASRRFRGLGKGTESGLYENRISRETDMIRNHLGIDMELIFPGDIFEYEDLNRALALFHDSHVDCILVLFHSWAEDNVWIRFLRDYGGGTAPLIYYYPAMNQVPFKDCANEDDFIQFLSAGGLVGMLVGSGSIHKQGRKAHIVVGTIERKKNEIISYANVCMLYNELRNARFGVLPSYNEIMWNTYMNPYEYYSYGPEITFISYDELYEISQLVQEQEINEWYRNTISNYQVVDSIEEEKFLASLKYSLGLSRIMKQHNLDALTLNDVDMRLFEKCGLRPGFYHSSINQTGSVLCPEGDLGITLSVFILKQLSKKQVNVIEPFYIEEYTNSFCAGHAGPNDYTDPESIDYVKIAIDTRFAKTSYRYAGAPPFAWLRIPPPQKQ